MDPTACEGCPSQVPVVLPWTSHILWLDRLVQCGCRYALGDLSVHEWRGLELLHEERTKHHNKQMKALERKRP